MKKILKLLGLILALLILVFVSVTIVYVIGVNSSKNSTKKFIEERNEFAKENVSYVVVEINPKAMLEIINNKVTNIGCLNEDCKNIFDINIEGKTLNDAIESLYETAKNKGINTTNGVKVSSTNHNIEKEVKKLGYVEYNKITKDEENTLLNEVINNQEIIDNKNNHNKKTLELYKKDKDYGKLYTCDIINNKLECYITNEFYNDIPAEPSILNIYDYNSKHQKLMNVLDKFNIEYETNVSDVEGFDLFKIIEIKKIKMNDNFYDFGICSLNDDTTTTCSNSIMLEKKLESGEYGYLYKTIAISKINLVDLTYDELNAEYSRNYQSSVITGPGIVEN